MLSVLTGVALAAECALPETSGESIPTATVQSKSYLARYRFEPHPLALGSPVVLVGRVCPKDGSRFTGRIKTDATMPQHGHGMNYRPTLTLGAAGQFRGVGFLLHMAGEWRFDLELIDGPRREKLTFSHHVR